MREVFEAESQKSQKPRLMTSIATAAGEWLLKHGYDIPVLCKVTKFGKITWKSTKFLKLIQFSKWLDMVNVMTYVSHLEDYNMLFVRT